MSQSNTQPTAAGFLVFIRQVVQIPVIYLPDNDPVFQDAFDASMAIVNPRLCIQSGGGYSRAVYNLGADNIINYAVDQPNQTFFQQKRKEFGIALFVPGVTLSSGDSGTSQSRVTPEFMKHLTFSDLQNLKTPWGRAYLGIAQATGTLWGIS